VRLKGFEKTYDLGINAFIKKYGGVEKRVWPNEFMDSSEDDISDSKPEKKGGAKLWFKRGNNRVPHNAPSSGTKRRKIVKEKIRSYLRDLFLFEPPESWFSGEQFGHLYEDLKHLVGACSTAHNDGPYNLTLGNLVILLAAACGEKYARPWIMTAVEWSGLNRTQQILPNQSGSQAREAVLSLVDEERGLFHCIKKHKNKEDEASDKKPIIEAVELREGELEVALDFDFTSETDGWSLRDKLLELPAPKDVGGDTYSAFREFLRASGKNERDMPERRCVLNWSQEGSQTKLKIKAV
jgi:hypothetical protein